jgi:hypothetical protein
VASGQEIAAPEDSCPSLQAASFPSLSAAAGAPAMSSLRLVIPAATPVQALNKMSKLLWDDIARRGPRAERLLAQLGEDVPDILKQSSSNVRNAEKLLRNALIEFYRGLGLLKSYRWGGADRERCKAESKHCRFGARLWRSCQSAASSHIESLVSHRTRSSGARPSVHE